MNTRKLNDRIETYEQVLKGFCLCGQKVHKVLKSNCTMWVNGDRYHYLDDNSASCIYRCKTCLMTIHETFKYYPQ